MEERSVSIFRARQSQKSGRTKRRQLYTSQEGSASQNTLIFVKTIVTAQNLESYLCFVFILFVRIINFSV